MTKEGAAGAMGLGGSSCGIEECTLIQIKNNGYNNAFKILICHYSFIRLYQRIADSLDYRKESLNNFQARVRTAAKNPSIPSF